MTLPLKSQVHKLCGQQKIFKEDIARVITDNYAK